MGVNWDVEIVQVQMGGLSESNVIGTYNYPYEMRALYNETGGARGAFVVATNASGALIWPIQPTTLCGADTTTTWASRAS